MNYLEITLEKNMAQLMLKTTNRLVVAEQEVELTEEPLLRKLDQVTKILTESTWDFIGVSINSKEEDRLAFCQSYLVEQLNKPVALASEFGGISDISTFFNDLAERLTWELTYFGYEPGKTEYSVESLLTIGNGYMGLRGTLPEMTISDAHYPATYLAGVYNSIDSIVDERTIVNEDFVNAPNLQYVSFKIGEGGILTITEATVKKLTRKLNLKNGLFTSELIALDSQGHLVKIDTKRVVSMANRHDYALHYTITPLNFSGELTVIAKSDGGVFNYNVERYRGLSNQHLVVTEATAKKSQTRLVAKTSQSGITIRQQSQLTSACFTEEAIDNDVAEDMVTQSVVIEVEQNQSYTIEKQVKVFVDHEPASEGGQPWEQEEHFVSFQEILATSQAAWLKLWQASDIQVTGDLMSQKLLRLHTYHLLVSGSPLTYHQLDVSITARGLHGEAYRGHIFWDELFIFPFYIMHFPEMAKQLLLYRYNRLGAAKENAIAAGYSGAMYPWQSGRDGTEQTQEVHLNPLSNEWGEDYSRLQRHVSLAIAYNVWSYWNNTHDKEFMMQYGAEMLLEIAEFWRSKTEYDQVTDTYSIAGVMGPDEFHEAYPNTQTGGLTNNAYTNVMVVWLFEEIEKLVQELPSDKLMALQEKSQVTPKKLTQMKRISRNLTLEINHEGIIAQYADYFMLKEVDWDYYKTKFGNVYRMDRILRADGKSADDYQVAKQADTLMLFYNFSKEKIDGIFAELGYDLPADYLEKNFNYYLERTSHGSTLSRIVHAQLAETVGQSALSWQLYQEALRSDYQDIQGGTTAEGIHTGVMAGTLTVTLTTYAGLEIREDLLEFHPDLPKNWQKLAFNLQRRGIHYQVEVTPTTIVLTASEDSEVSVVGQTCVLKKGQARRISYEVLVKAREAMIG